MEKISVSDLSIGDWVIVEWLDGERWRGKLTRLSVTGAVEVCCANDKHVRCSDGFISAIPITAEILEKNGLEQNSNCLDYRFIIGNIYCSISMGIKCWYVNIYDISNSPHTPIFKAHIIHIHELQHALRLAKVGKEIIL